MRESVSVTELRDSIAAKKERLTFRPAQGNPLPSDEDDSQLVFVSQLVARIQSQQGCQCRLAINQYGLCFLEYWVVPPIGSAVDGGEKVRHPVIPIQI